MPDPSVTLRIVCGNIFPRDAVGNFCLDIYQLCQQNKIPAVLYAANFDPMLDEIKKASALFNEAAPRDTLLYFHSIYDPLLDDIVQMEVKKKIVYFHGITQPGHFKVFNFELSAACEKGYQQLPFLAKFDLWAANSLATANVLVHHVNKIHLDSVKVISPRLISSASVRNLDHKISNRTEHTKLLYVGRIKSSKKIEDLMRLFAEYLSIDSDAECWIVGGQDDRAYRDYLAWIEERYLGSRKSRVKWFGQVSDEKRDDIYRSATAYVSMSEDEGFCLPLLESMLAGLPVFAYGIAAVREVLGEAGVYFSRKDFPCLAQSIHRVLMDPIHVQEMIDKQYQRAKTLAENMDGRAVLRLLEDVS